jgi:hypothetical protein
MACKVEAQLKIFPAGQELQSAVTDEQAGLREGDRPLTDGVAVLVVDKFCDPLACAGVVADATRDESCRLGIRVDRVHGLDVAGVQMKANAR